MGLLPNIELTRMEYESLLRYRCEEGGEGRVIQLGTTAVKLFYDDFGHFDSSSLEVEKIRNNKFSKLELLFSLKEKFPNQFRPVASYSYQRKFVGFEGQWMPYPTLQSACLSREEQIFYLKKVREKLQKFHELGIVYGDLKSNNVMIDTVHKDVVFIDIDNMKVKDYPFDLMSSIVTEVVSWYGKVDWKVDSYMMNLLTISELNDFPIGVYGSVYDCLEKKELPTVLLGKNKCLTRKLSRLCQQMVNLDKDYSGHYFIDEV